LTVKIAGLRPADSRGRLSPHFGFGQLYILTEKQLGHD
jgi:hypothetical protein